MEGKLQSLRGESSNRFMKGKMESNLNRGVTPLPCSPQLETLLCRSEGRPGTEAQALEVSHRERTRVRCGNSLKRLGCGNGGCTRKKPGPARDVRHHYWEVHEERAGLP